MNKAKTKKAKVIKTIQEKLAKSQVVILTDYKGLTMAQLTQLRKLLRPVEAEYKVFKNTLINLALKDRALDGVDGILKGSTAVVFGYKDQVLPAKILTKFMKENEKLVIKAGIMEGNLIDQNMISSLAKLPSREVLLASVVRGMQAPLSNFVGDLSGILRKFLYAVNAVKDKKSTGN
jgi:large subunit ribosomal protein L10